MRLAKFVGGVAVIKVSAATETEMKEKNARVEDALNATRAAVGEGQRVGVNIVRRAIEEPWRQISANAGKEGSIIVQRVKEGKGGFGYNAATDTFEDLLEAGVIDPTKVVRSALQNAASVASLLITTEALIVEKKKDEAPAAGGGGGGHEH